MNQQDKRRLFGRPSPAMVVAMTALIVALSGSAYAAFRVPPNSVGSRQLKAKAVTGGKIADGAIGAGKIEAGSLTGADINMAALGTVPSATSATSATNANTVGGHSASCPSATTLIRGLCFDSHSNPQAPNLEAAAEDCAARGGWLPTPMELYSTRQVLDLGTGVGAEQHQYTDQLYGVVEGGKVDTTVVVDGIGAPIEQETTQPSAYTCVYPLIR